MNRIDQVLNELAQKGEKVLSPYITAGDPTPEATVDIMHALVGAGANILELGIPFSDPMAEGPVIQAAMERALAHGVHCDTVFEMVRSFRKKDNKTPIILMGYSNPIEFYGYEDFAKQAQQVGVDGTIIVDLPPEESAHMHAIWKEHNLYNIYLCSPTTTLERMELINQLAQGYLYFVSLKGVTGSNEFDLKTVKSMYEQRKQQTHLPLLVGFGIKTPQLAAEVAAFADGVIVGAGLITAIIDAYQAKQNYAAAAAAFIQDMRNAMNNG